MPVDYKLRNLRRLFGESNLLRNVTTPKPSTTSGSATDQTPTRSRKVKQHGGIPRHIFSQTPPRAIRNKPAGAQLHSVHLIEKQKMRLYYGAIRDYQFAAYVNRAKARRKNVDAQLIRMLELRLDTFLYRTGFVKTPPQGRQWILHARVELNGKPVTVKSARVRVGDVLGFQEAWEDKVMQASKEAAEMRERYGVGKSWIVGGDDVGMGGMLPWMEIDREGLKAVLVREPTDQEAREISHAALLPWVRAANLSPFAAMRYYR